LRTSRLFFAIFAVEAFWIPQLLDLEIWLAGKLLHSAETGFRNEIEAAVISFIIPVSSCAVLNVCDLVHWKFFS
jgi:hypothetical protein